MTLNFFQISESSLLAENNPHDDMPNNISNNELPNNSQDVGCEVSITY